MVVKVGLYIGFAAAIKWRVHEIDAEGTFLLAIISLTASVAQRRMPA
jgi:hypothetical protein